MKLNLCSGFNLLPDYTNVDMMASTGADIIFDLETFPWLWEDSSIEEIRFYHALEHLGADVETYFAIWKEIYRICKPGAMVKITIPYPWHDTFMDDPTHVRAITPDGLRLFSKKWNQENIDKGYSNSPLGIYLDIDFEIDKIDYGIDKDAWEESEKVGTAKMAKDDFIKSAQLHRNLIREIHIEMRMVK